MKERAKDLFYRSLDEYLKATAQNRLKMINSVKEQANEREKYIDDEYTICAKWFIRLENYLNRF